MTVHNGDIAAIFEEMADLLDIEGANPFRVRAYRFAARTIRDLPGEVAEMVARGEDLTSLPGIGDDLAGKILEIIRTGTVAALEAQRHKTPATLTELLRIPGLGPKRVQALVRALNLRGLSDLQQAAREGRIRTIPGFGEKTEQHILDALAARTGKESRMQLAVAMPSAEALVAYLNQCPGVGRVVVAGSYRRARETIGDLDILVTADTGRAITDRFIRYPEVREVLAHGETKASVRLQNHLQVDVRVVPD